MKAAHAPYARWLDHEAAYRESEQYASDRRFWQGTDRTRRGVISATVSSPRSGIATPWRAAGRASPARHRRSGLTTPVQGPGQGRGVTPFTALLAGFQGSCPGRTDLACPSSGFRSPTRTTRELKQVVGTCVNLLPLLPFHGANGDFRPRDPGVHPSTRWRRCSSTRLFPYQGDVRALPGGDVGGPRSPPVEVHVSTSSRSASCRGSTTSAPCWSPR